MQTSIGKASNISKILVRQLESVLQRCVILLRRYFSSKVVCNGETD